MNSEYGEADQKTGVRPKHLFNGSYRDFPGDALPTARFFATAIPGMDVRADDDGNFKLKGVWEGETKIGNTPVIIRVEYPFEGRSNKLLIVIANHNRLERWTVKEWGGSQREPDTIAFSQEELAVPRTILSDRIKGSHRFSPNLYLSVPLYGGIIPENITRMSNLPWRTLRQVSREDTYQLFQGFDDFHQGMNAVLSIKQAVLEANKGIVSQQPIYEELIISTSRTVTEVHL